MTTLLAFVILYLLVSIGIGLFAASRVHSAKDFAVAGRSLPLSVATALASANSTRSTLPALAPSAGVPSGLGDPGPGHRPAGKEG